ncbi:MAG: STAS domain-containing protein [Planctomycetota bacterium]
MKIETTTSPSHTTLVLRGDFETDAADRFLGAVGELQAAGSNRLMVSFRYVKYINSTALGAVVRARANCRANGGNLVIVRPSRLTHDIITKMGLDSVLPLFEDEAAATNFLAGQGNAPETVPAGQTADDAERIVVMFSFDDDRANLIPGKSHHGIGLVDSVDASSLVFRWNPSQHASDAATAAAMFTAGSTMRNKLQIKMIRKGFFEADSTIQGTTTNESGDVTVTARWARMADADRRALERYRDDIAFLKTQKGNRSADEAK